MELTEIKRLTVLLPEHIYFSFIQRVKHYKIHSNDIFIELVLKFNAGDFDELFGFDKE